MGPGILRRFCSLAMLGALALQMELPVAHAPAHPSLAQIVAPGQGASPPDLRPAASHASAHDPSACPVCQSLHAKPALPQAQAARAPAERGPVIVAIAPVGLGLTAERSHPPRAPPLEALSIT